MDQKRSAPGPSFRFTGRACASKSSIKQPLPSTDTSNVAVQVLGDRFAARRCLGPRSRTEDGPGRVMAPREEIAAICSLCFCLSSTIGFRGPWWCYFGCVLARISCEWLVCHGKEEQGVCVFLCFGTGSAWVKVSVSACGPF